MMMYITKNDAFTEVLHKIAAETAGQFPDAAPAAEIQSEEPNRTADHNADVMTDNALKARREYGRKYREENRERLREYHRNWSRDNPERVRAHQARYWQRQAERMTAANSEEPTT